MPGFSRSTAPDPLPRWLWPLTLGGVALVVAVIGVGAWAIRQGAADPPVAGPVIWQADAQTGALAWISAAPLTLDPTASGWASAPPDALLPTDRPFTLSVRATLAAGSDAGATWGIWAASTDGSRIVWAVRGDGYLTIRRCPASARAPVPDADLEACPALIPDWRWHAYPRILPPGRANTLTLHREPDGIRLRVNDERLGIAPLDLAGAWGVWWRGGDSAAAVLRWDRAALRAP